MPITTYLHELIKSFITKQRHKTDDDPVKNCDLHNTIGCQDVDRSACFFPECSALEEFKAKF